ncbi:MAG: tetratricopeptide repeat protein [Brumimicrobium sp.]
MNRYFHIVLIFCFSFGINAQIKDKEESMKEESLDDIEALSSKNFPYIERFHQAVREKLAGNLDEAKKLYEECLEEKSDDDAVYFGLGEIAKEQKLNTTALDYFKKAQELDKDNIFYTQELAYIQYEKADFEDAVENFSKLVEHEPRNVDWVYGYGKVLVYSKNYEKAITVFNQLQDQVGVVPEIMIMKADLYQELDQLDKTEETLLLLKKEFPNNTEVLETIIAFYEDQGEDEKAFQLIKELALNDHENGVAHLILANEYARKGENEEFLKSLPVVVGSEEIGLEDKMKLLEHLYSIPNVTDSVVLKLSKTLAEVHQNDAKSLTFRAEVLSQSGQTKEALYFYREALKNNTDEYRLWTSILAFESAYKDYQALYEDAKEAISYFPSLPFVYYAAAEGALYTGREDEAMDFLSQGELYILDDDKQKARFSMRKGEIYFAQKKFKEGVEAYNKAMSLNENSATIKINYAFSLAKSEKNLTKAEALLESVEKEKRGSDFYYTKAYLQYKKGNTNEGIKTVQEGISEVRYKAELYDLLGDLFIHNNQLEKAIEAWEKAKKLESRNTLLDKKIKEKTFYAPQYY